MKIESLITQLVKSILGSILLFTSLLLFINVILRYVFLAPIFWAEELARYLMVWLIFLGSAALVSHEGHISVNLIQRFISTKAQTILTLIVSLISCLFCVVLCYYSWQHTANVRLAQQITPALGLPMWLAYLAIPVGSGLMAWAYAAEIFRSLWRKDS